MNKNRTSSTSTYVFIKVSTIHRVVVHFVASATTLPSYAISSVIASPITCRSVMSYNKPRPCNSVSNKGLIGCVGVGESIVLDEEEIR